MSTKGCTLFFKVVPYTTSPERKLSLSLPVFSYTIHFPKNALIAVNLDSRESWIRKGSIHLKNQRFWIDRVNKTNTFI
jgi:hypothetical protein